MLKAECGCLLSWRITVVFSWLLFVFSEQVQDVCKWYNQPLDVFVIEAKKYQDLVDSGLVIMEVVFVFSVFVFVKYSGLKYIVSWCHNDDLPTCGRANLWSRNNYATRRDPMGTVIHQCYAVTLIMIKCDRAGPKSCTTCAFWGLSKPMEQQSEYVPISASVCHNCCL